MINTVFVAGYGNSLGKHWQNIWHQQTENSFWVAQRDWDNPQCEDWVEALNTLLTSLEGPVLLITHSLGGSTLNEWSKRFQGKILAAFIVAPPDVESDYLPDAIQGYQNLPLQPLPFPSVLVASNDDPYCSLPRAQFFAQQWGADFIDAGKLGHINVQSELGEWAQGQAMLASFMQQLK